MANGGDISPRPPAATIETLDLPSPAQLNALRRMALHCVHNFPTYRKIFHDAGVTERDVESADPLEILRNLPPIGGEELRRVSMEAVSAIDAIVDTETSSGTAGESKIRFISYEDDMAEHRFLARLLKTCGIAASDKVACMDTDPAAVMVAFPRACELIPTTESYCVSVGTRFDRMAPLFRRLKPTALISVPSIIQKSLDAAEESGCPMPDTIRRVIHIGEGMQAPLRKRILDTLGAQVFSYYGSSETSALGIECAERSGIHLFGSRTLFEIQKDPSMPDQGELIVTTLAQRALPLLRYRLGDIARPRPGSCACGLKDPRIDVIGRSDMSASILGSKIHHHSIYASMERAGLSGPLQIILETNRRSETMRLRLADHNSSAEERLLAAALADHQDIEFLRDSGLLDLKVEFIPARELLGDRKPNKLVDLRS